MIILFKIHQTCSVQTKKFETWRVLWWFSKAEKSATLFFKTGFWLMLTRKSSSSRWQHWENWRRWSYRRKGEDREDGEIMLQYLREKWLEDEKVIANIAEFKWGLKKWIWIDSVAAEKEFSMFPVYADSFKSLTTVFHRLKAAVTVRILRIFLKNLKILPLLFE
jgi:hypothetical protein